MNTTQQTILTSLKTAAAAQNATIKRELSNQDGSYTVHLSSPCGGTMCYLIKADGKVSRSWL